MIFFPFSVHFHLSPDDNFPDLSHGCFAEGGRAGAFALSLFLPRASSALATFPTSFLLPTELVKINMFCLHIFEWLAIWLMGWILEGQQLHASGFGLEKYVWKINKPDTHMRAHMQPWAGFSRHGGGKKRIN